MASQFLKDIASSALLGTTPKVSRPSVKAPSPFDDDERMDISDRFRPTPDFTSPDSFYGGASVGGGDSDRYYTGSLDITGLGANVADRFVGMDKALGAAISPLGFNPLIGAGAFLSKKNLTNIQNKMRAGEQGYSVGMFNGRIIGVSPGPFGGYVLSGVLPPGLTPQQRNQIAEQLLAMNQPSPVDPAVPPGSDVPDPDTGLTGPESDAGAGDFRPGVDAPATPVPQPPLPDFDDDPDPDTGTTGPESDAGAGDYRPGVDDPYVPPPTSPPVSPPDDFYPGDPGMDPSPPSQPDPGDDDNNDRPGLAPDPPGDDYDEDDFMDDDGDYTDGWDPNDNDDDSGGGGGGGGGCCFIMLEARYGDGTMDDVVRRYRDEHMTDRNKRGYYKVAEVLVPLMRKSRLAKWLVTMTFADPLVSYGKYYYGQNKHGVIFAPVKSFWMSVFNIVGGETEFIRENGKVV